MNLGCLLGYHYTDGFQEAFDSGDVLRDDANNHSGNIQKLHANRVDGIIIDKETGFYLIKQLGLSSGDFGIAYMFKTRSVLYMRIHKQKEHILPALNTALEEMKEDGAIQAIVKKYTQ